MKPFGVAFFGGPVGGLVPCFKNPSPNVPQLDHEISIMFRKILVKLQRCTRLHLYSLKMFEVTFVHPCQYLINTQILKKHGGLFVEWSPSSLSLPHRRIPARPGNSNFDS